MGESLRMENRHSLTQSLLLTAVELGRFKCWAAGLEEEGV